MQTLPWLITPLQDFCRQLKSEQLGHAYLVGMHSGYGGDSLTLSMAKAALCTELGAQGACGFCKACQLVAANSHPGLYLIVADGHQIKVDQIRALCQKLTSTSQQGGRRVAVICHSERLNIASANALLKTLEEPGKETLLLLQSDTPARLMPTISSRCQRLHFSLPSIADMGLWLGKRTGHGIETTWCLAAMGGPLELANALEGDRYTQLLQYRRDWAQSLSSGHLCASLISINEKQASDALKVLYLVLRNKLIKQTDIDPLLRVKIIKFSTEVMEHFHRLSGMPNVNYLSLFQSFLLQYRSFTQ